MGLFLTKLNCWLERSAEIKADCRAETSQLERNGNCRGVVLIRRSFKVNAAARHFS